MKRVHPDELINEVVKHTFENEYEGLAVEAQAAQEFIADTMEERLQARGYPAHTRVKQIKHHSGSRKAFRIESLLLYKQSGNIIFDQKFRNTPDRKSVV